MVNGQSTTIRNALLALLVLLAGGGLGWAAWLEQGSHKPIQPMRAMAAPVKVAPAKPKPLPIPEPPPVAQVLRSGVLIVISKASQQMYVFKDGQSWGASPVSTGRRGHATPAGIFPILQKRVRHRSNIYSNAPMPYMQRLTWSGIAIHAGHLPGYPASHGCIRLPRAFAKSLFALTQASSTTVVIANEALASESRAQQFALSLPPPRPVVPSVPAVAPVAELAAAPTAAPAATATPAPAPVVPPAAPVVPKPELAPAPQGQTIQLVAAASQAEAEAHWSRLLRARPELARFSKAVIPAVVGSRQVYRLRVSAADAHAYCRTLKSAGIDCFSVG